MPALSLHELIRLSMQACGYRATEKGVCHGISFVAMQSILLRDTDTFDGRIHTIDQYRENVDGLTTAINKSKGKPKQQKKAVDYKNLDILAFYEGIELSQHAYLYPELYESDQIPKSQEDIESTIPLLIPQQLKEKNISIKLDDTKNHKFTGFYDNYTLASYFNSLYQALAGTEPQVTEPFVLMLSSGNHTITVGCDFQKKEWLFIDANDLPTKHIPITDSYQIGNKVSSAFSDNGMVVFKTQIFGLSTNEKVWKKAIENWTQQKDFKDIHTISKKDRALTKTDSHQTSLLYLAVNNGDSELVNNLLAQGAKVDITTPDGVTPLAAAAKRGDTKMVENLIKHGANINLASPKYGTPLMIAIDNHQPEIMKILLDNKADINAIHPETKSTALHIAAQSGDLETFKVLLAKGAKLDAVAVIGMTALHVAAITGKINIVNFLLNETTNKMLDMQNAYQNTPLHLAAAKGHINVVEALADKGANINSIGEDDTTPLFIAAQDGRLETVKLLLSRHADINLKRKSDQASPLHAAAHNGHDEVVKELLKHGADITDVTSSHASVLEIAAAKGNAKVVTTLLEHGKEYYKAHFDIAESALEWGKKNQYQAVIDVLTPFVYEQKLIQYIGSRDADMREYQKSLTVFGQTLHFGYSKLQKLEAAKKLLDVVQGRAESASLKDYEPILNNGQLKPLYLNLIKPISKPLPIQHNAKIGK